VERDGEDRAVAQDEAGPPSVPRGAGVSRTAIDLVAAYGLAQWNVVQARLLDVGADQVRIAKERQVAAYGALMEYIARLERRGDGGRG
jgi:hypothetical protein